MKSSTRLLQRQQSQKLHMRRSMDNLVPGPESEQQHKHRYNSLHRAVEEYRQISSSLGLRLFESTSQAKKEMGMLINMRWTTKEREKENDPLYREQFVVRRKRRQILGIQEAEISNHRNTVWGIPGTASKRKLTTLNKKKNFEVSQHVKGKFNIKGFAARISHSLGKQKLGVRGLTKMINTDLIN